MENFFRTVSYILAAQLRQIVHDSIHDFLMLFDGNQYHSIYAKDNMKPVAFNVRLLLDGEKLVFDPPLSDIQNTIEGLFDQLVLAADKIPKVESQLFSLQQSPQKSKSVVPEVSFIRVAYENTVPVQVQRAKKQLRESLKQMLEAPVQHLQEYQKYNSLIKKTAELEAQAFVKETHTLAQQTDVTTSIRDIFGSSSLRKSNVTARWRAISAMEKVFM